MMNREKPGFLKRTFKAVAKSVSGAVIVLPFIASGVVMYGESPSTPLTDGERALLAGIFGDQLDMSVIRLHRSEPRLGHGVGGAVLLVPFRTNHIYVKPRFYAQDFSETDTGKNRIYKYGLLTHEATHVWQHQNWLLRNKFFCETDDPDDDYFYVLKPGKAFMDYCSEQQASMVQHYAVYFLHPKGYEPGYGEMRGSMEELRAIVEAQFPQARQTREALEKKRGKGPGPHP